MSKYVAPAHALKAYNCPHCEAYAQQIWFPVRADEGSHTASRPEISLCYCTLCKRESIWLKKEMLYPISSSAPIASEDMPEDVNADYKEARNIVTNSPRSACALLRLALQKLMPHLGRKGKNINDDIGSLVKKGLPEKIQKALDSVRVIGNNAVHPGEIDLKDDESTAISLFSLINMIVEVMITQQKEVEKIFDGLPTGAKEAIKKRNSGNKEEESG